MFANVALVFSGQFVRYVSQMKVRVRVRIRARVRVRVRARVRVRVRGRVGLGLGLGLMMITEHGEKGLSASRLAVLLWSYLHVVTTTLLSSTSMSAGYHPRKARLPVGVDAWGVALNYLMSAVCLSGAVTMGCYRYLAKNARRPRGRG